MIEMHFEPKPRDYRAEVMESIRAFTKEYGKPPKQVKVPMVVLNELRAKTLRFPWDDRPSINWFALDAPAFPPLLKYWDVEIVPK